MRTMMGKIHFAGKHHQISGFRALGEHLQPGKTQLTSRHCGVKNALKSIFPKEHLRLTWGIISWSGLLMMNTHWVFQQLHLFKTPEHLSSFLVVEPFSSIVNPVLLYHKAPLQSWWKANTACGVVSSSIFLSMYCRGKLVFLLYSLLIVIKEEKS